jgi:hypothetical protein
MILWKLRSGSEAVSKCYATIPFQILALFLNTCCSPEVCYSYVAHTDMSEINVQAAEYSARASSALRRSSTRGTCVWCFLSSLLLGKVEAMFEGRLIENW